MKLSIHYSAKKIFENKKLLISTIIIVSLIIRIPAIYFFGDSRLEYEWLVLINNLTNQKEFAFRNFGNFYIPNLYMPPLYAWFLYAFKLLNLSNENYINLILYIQAILASISLVTFYFICKKFFSDNLSLFLTVLFCFFPSYLYACGQISSITLYIFLIVLFIFFLLNIPNETNYKFSFYLGLAAGLSILLRGEFILIFSFCLIYLFFFYKNVNLKKIILTSFITLLVLSPYLYRNISELNTFSITKSIGFNLWKGNNPNSNVEGDLIRHVSDRGPIGFEGDLKEKITNLPVDKYFDINLDNLFLDESIKNIKNEPGRYLVLYIKKFISFLFVDLNSTIKNYYHPLHLIPLIIISFSSFIGMLISIGNSKNLNLIAMLYLSYIFIFSFFFILPRYNLIILPMQILLTGELINKLYKKTT